MYGSYSRYRNLLLILHLSTELTSFTFFKFSCCFSLLAVSTGACIIRLSMPSDRTKYPVKSAGFLSALSMASFKEIRCVSSFGRIIFTSLTNSRISLTLLHDKKLYRIYRLHTNHMFLHAHINVQVKKKIFILNKKGKYVVWFKKVQQQENQLRSSNPLPITTMR